MPDNIILTKKRLAVLQTLLAEGQIDGYFLVVTKGHNTYESSVDITPKTGYALVGCVHQALHETLTDIQNGNEGDA